MQNIGGEKSMVLKALGPQICRQFYLRMCVCVTFNSCRLCQMCHKWQLEIVCGYISISGATNCNNENYLVVGEICILKILKFVFNLKRRTEKL